MDEKFTKADAAKFVLKLINENLERSRTEYYTSNATVESARHANALYFKDEEQLGFFGPSKEPYPESSLSHLNNLSRRATETFNDWQKVREWYLEDILEKYVK